MQSFNKRPIFSRLFSSIKLVPLLKLKRSKDYLKKRPISSCENNLFLFIKTNYYYLLKTTYKAMVIFKLFKNRPLFYIYIFNNDSIIFQNVWAIIIFFSGSQTNIHRFYRKQQSHLTFKCDYFYLLANTIRYIKFELPQSLIYLLWLCSFLLYP